MSLRGGASDDKLSSPAKSEGSPMAGGKSSASGLSWADFMKESGSPASASPLSGALGSRSRDEEGDSADSGSVPTNSPVIKSQSSRSLKSGLLMRTPSQDMKPRRDSPVDRQPRDRTGSLGLQSSRGLSKSSTQSEPSNSPSAGSPVPERVAVGGSLHTATSAAASAPSAPPRDADAIHGADPATGETVLRAGTLDRLIDRLTQDAGSDPGFVGIFLLTFRAFVTAGELLTLLERRFEIQPPTDLQGTALENFKRKIQPQRLRLCIVLRYWLANFSDFDETLLGRISGLIELHIAPQLAQSAHSLSALVERRRHGTAEPAVSFPVPPPRPLVDRISWQRLRETCPAAELARQLTLIEQEYFVRIKPWEFLRQAWLKAGKEQLAPNLLSCSRRFNQVSHWLTSCVLLGITHRERVQMVEYVVAVAQECLQLQNYSGCLECLSALQQAPVQRLKDVWNDVEKKSRKAFDEMSHTFLPLNNWRSARELLMKGATPCIPYIGIFLTDLVFIEEGNPDFIESPLQPSLQLINFEKHRKVAAVIQRIQLYQQSPYWLEPLPALREHLLALKPLTEPEMFERSYALLPNLRKARPLRDDTVTKPPEQLQELAAFVFESVATTLEQRFPRALISSWSGLDRDRRVYDWPDEIRLDVVEHAGGTYVVLPRLVASRAELTTLHRMVAFYNESTQRTARGLMVSLLMGLDELKLAREPPYSFEVLLLDQCMPSQMLAVPLVSQQQPPPPQQPVETAMQLLQSRSPVIRSAAAGGTSGSGRAPQPQVQAQQTRIKIPLTRSDTPPSVGIPTSASTPISISLGRPAALSASAPLVSASPTASATDTSPSSQSVPLPSSPSVMFRVTDFKTWIDVCLAAEMSAEQAAEIDRLMVENAFELDQWRELTLDVLKQIGLKLGPAMKLFKFLQARFVS